LSAIKDQLLEEWERRWASPGEYHVCARCVNDEALRDLIVGQASELECDYCGRRARIHPCATHVDTLFEHMGGCILAEYTGAEEELPYESREGGYQGYTFLSDELLEEVGDPFVSDELREHFVESFGDTTWCEKDYFGLSEDAALICGWSDFTRQVTTNSRFLSSMLQLSEDRWASETFTPIEMLQAIGQIVERAGLTKVLPRGTTFFRARQHKLHEDVSSHIGLGPPTCDRARASRMSPPGIALFYGAFDRPTAINEVIDRKKRADYWMVSSGRFRTARAVLVVDLSHMPTIPSFWDAERAAQRHAMVFLRHFAQEISKPVRAHDVDYVPTQVVTEFFRNHFRTSPGDEVEGILFASAKWPGGTCCALFANAEDCTDQSLQWERSGKLLALDRASIQASRVTEL
jgi:hypothetical protein